jgi:hypothetical protein
MPSLSINQLAGFVRFSLGMELVLPYLIPHGQYNALSLEEL